MVALQSPHSSIDRPTPGALGGEQPARIHPPPPDRAATIVVPRTRARTGPGFGLGRGFLAWFFLAALALRVAPAAAQVVDSTLWVTNGSVHAIARDGNTIYVGGQFTKVRPVNGEWQTRNYIAALDATTGAATAWDPNANWPVTALAVSGGAVYVGGSFTSIGDSVRHYIAALDATTGTATAWNPDAGWPVNTLAVSGGTVYAGGKFSSIGGKAREYIAALDAATGAVTAWNPNASGEVYVLAVSGSTVYAGGTFSSIGGKARNRIAALDATKDTLNATDWNPNAIGSFLPYVHALVVSGSTVYAGGSFTSMGDSTRHNIAALDSATGAATAWNPDAYGQVRALAVSGSTVYAGGWFNSMGDSTRYYIAALDAVTGKATAWNPGASPPPVEVLVASEATICAGGYFRSIGGRPQTYLAAITFGTVDVPTTAETHALALAQAIPNPARSHALLRFTLPCGGFVTLAVYDLEGRRVALPLDRALRSAGPQEVSVRTEGWPPGCYFCRLEFGGLSLTRKMVVLE